MNDDSAVLYDNRLLFTTGVISPGMLGRLFPEREERDIRLPRGLYCAVVIHDVRYSIGDVSEENSATGSLMSGISESAHCPLARAPGISKPMPLYVRRAPLRLYVKSASFRL